MRLQGGARDLWMMPLFDGAAFRIFDGTFPVQIGVMQIIAVATAVVAIGSVFFVMQFTAAGRYWKACSQSERLAKLSGVDTLTVLRWSLCWLGSACQCFGLDHCRFLWRRYFFDGTHAGVQSNVCFRYRRIWND